MRRVLLLGGSGHARVVADAIASLGEASILGFVADREERASAAYPVLGADDELPALHKAHGPFDLMLAIGSGELRRRIVDKIAAMRLPIDYMTVVHPRANLAGAVRLGAGTFVAIGATLGVNAACGRHVLINTNASVDHDCVLGDYVSIAPNAALGGSVVVGEAAMVGIGATVIQGIRIGAGAMVAAGAVVIRDVPDGALVMGVPAREVPWPAQR
jgi:acetyltransferase EpsM